MKHFARTTLLLLALATGATAAPLPKQEVASDAKWLLHFDLAQFRSTRVGAYVVDEVARKFLEEPLADLRREMAFQVDADKLLHGITSVTAYGSDYKSPEDAVFLLRIDPDLQQICVGALAGLSLAGSDAPVHIELSKIGDIAVYTLKGHGILPVIAVVPGRMLVIGKSHAATEKALAVLSGKMSNLTSSKAFAGFPDVREGFFFLAVAEGFNIDRNLPPQARLLQLADGGRIVLGEAAGNVFLNVALKAKSPEVVQQMQQVVQGLIALGSLGKPDDKDLAALLQSVKVATTENVVSVGVEYSADKLLQELHAGFHPRRAKQNPATADVPAPSNP